MKPTYEELIKFMEDYFKAYNDYAQNPATVNKMSGYFTPDVHFIPYISAFGGPENGAVTSRDDFFHMFTGHPSVTRNSKTSRTLLSTRGGWWQRPCFMWRFMNRRRTKCC